MAHIKEKIQYTHTHTLKIYSIMLGSIEKVQLIWRQRLPSNTYKK